MCLSERCLDCVATYMIEDSLLTDSGEEKEHGLPQIFLVFHNFFLHFSNFSQVSWFSISLVFLIFLAFRRLGCGRFFPMVDPWVSSYVLPKISPYSLSFLAIQALGVREQGYSSMNRHFGLFITNGIQQKVAMSSYNPPEETRLWKAPPRVGTRNL